MQEKDSKLALTIKDDGPGLSDLSEQKNQQFGGMLMTTLSEQLGGLLERNSDKQGTVVTLNFPKQLSPS